ncbi:hypothetical protein DM02DRAFT_393900 [Periconia macrospinosa]|uniref:Uncharacterized protein n=1 Tax=Periconia macrospinosa TaxID=97972 RepID=A0A2V1DR55_9PLEO|nr:hypothetical protein DM02DRAFT_393900 [Periconia macrospinosa]
MTIRSTSRRVSTVFLWRMVPRHAPSQDCSGTQSESRAFPSHGQSILRGRLQSIKVRNLCSSRRWAGMSHVLKKGPRTRRGADAIQVFSSLLTGTGRRT